MPPPKMHRPTARIVMRAAIVVSFMAVAGAAAWLIGTDYLAGSGTVARPVECTSCTLHHRDMARLRQFLKNERQKNKMDESAAAAGRN